MDKKYQPHKFEEKHYKCWEENGYFKPQGKGDPYCIVIPPPNVTGTLHMGHAFQDTIMDSLTRYHRMMGFNTLWQPGTDHAGIATQMVVERILNAEGLSRLDLNREDFIKRVWEWKEESGGKISKQLRRIGASLDWDRDCFTMDEKLSEAVQTVFITLYEEGLIYRGKRLVNWDPVLHTALSDLEVLSAEEEGNLWYLEYPIKNSNKLLTVATTRPETVMGDSAVAVNPDDERYLNLIGKNVILPIVNREIPIIADDYVESDFGTGCLKITPAHDFNDYEVGLRHKLPIINIFNDSAELNENVPKKFRGLSRESAREVIVSEFKKLGLLKKIEKHKSKIPRGDRSGVVVEPYLTDQWFVDIKPLAEPAIEAVKNNDIQFVPDNWKKTYFEWMENIQDWCISRQLWWGHRIPAWYDDNGNTYVGKNEKEIRQKFKINKDINLSQDEDVLDTWFSSALWPFSTQGWPENTESLKTFYPGQVLVTGFDIIFFWVARMIMMGIKFKKEVPFKKVYIHGLIRDQYGQKMSKSKGNVLDPIDLIKGSSIENLLKKRTSGLMQSHLKPEIEKNTIDEFPDGINSYGADALRYTFASLATTGRDIRFDMGRIEGYKNFCNKLWNAAHYVIDNTHNCNLSNEKIACSNPIDLWIRTEQNKTINKVHKNFENYRLDLASQNLYEFVWHEFCDWYIELTKAILNDNSIQDSEKLGTKKNLLIVLESILRLLHPIIPFITEEIWLHIKDKFLFEDKTIMTRQYPIYDEKDTYKKESSDIEWIKKFILGIRQIRGELNISPKIGLEVLLKNYTPKDTKIIKQHEYLIKRTARVKEIKLMDQNESEPLSAAALHGKMKILVPLIDHIDISDEIARLEKQATTLKNEILKSQKKLDNKGFREKAPKSVVEEEQKRIKAKSLLINELSAQIDHLIKLSNKS